MEEEKRINKTARVKVIGLTLETRPDSINHEELVRFREYGVTRVQLGIQHTDDSVLKKVNRGCLKEDAVRAMKLLKESCWKVDTHFMPNLPGSSPKMAQYGARYSMKSVVLAAPRKQRLITLAEPEELNLSSIAR